MYQLLLKKVNDNDSVAAMSSTTSMTPCVTAKFSPLARPSFSGWVSFLLDKLFQFQLSCVIVHVLPEQFFYSDVVLLPVGLRNSMSVSPWPWYDMQSVPFLRL